MPDDTKCYLATFKKGSNICSIAIITYRKTFPYNKLRIPKVFRTRHSTSPKPNRFRFPPLSRPERLPFPGEQFQLLFLAYFTSKILNLENHFRIFVFPILDLFHFFIYNKICSVFCPFLEPS